MSKIEIVPATLSMLDGIVEIENACFSCAWSRRSLEEELKNEQAHFLAAICGDTVAGYIGSMEICGECYITNVAVLQSFRGQGIGAALVNSAALGAQERGCEFITLEVRCSNDGAIRLYTRCGFETVGERREFYEKPTEDALIMTKFFAH